MKHRRVVIQIEANTNLKVKDLRNLHGWLLALADGGDLDAEILEKPKVNVIRKDPVRRKGVRRKRLPEPF